LRSIQHERLIGAIAVRWTHLENAIQHMFWAISGLDSRTGRCITQHMSFRALNDAILSICHETPKYKNHYAEVKELLSVADRLRGERNNQIHALWGIILSPDGPKEVQADEVTGLLIKARGKLSSTVVHTKIEEIERKLEEIEECRTKIHLLYRKVAGEINRPEEKRT
ncbi:hypothetical protein, partial [Litorivivens sp.]|uniref:hypothetical protein n=1 Tax=Litorivivens sp. TaxID=2020868 RepID=UPI0035636156